MIVSNVDSGTLYTINGYAVDSIAMCNLRLSSQPSAYISATYNNNLLFTASAVSGTPMQYFTVPKGTIITTVADTDREYKRVAESSLLASSYNTGWVSGKCISGWLELKSNKAELITLRDNTISFYTNVCISSVPIQKTASQYAVLSGISPAYYSSMYAGGLRSDWTAHLQAHYGLPGGLVPTGSQKVNIKYVFPGVSDDPSGYLNSAGVNKYWTSYPTSLRNFSVSTATTVLASASGDIPPYVTTNINYTTIMP